MKHDNLIKNLSLKGENISDSTRFTNTQYLVKNGEICVITKNDGKLSILFSHLDDFIEELKEYKEVYG